MVIKKIYINVNLLITLRKTENLSCAPSDINSFILSAFASESNIGQHTRMRFTMQYLRISNVDQNYLKVLTLMANHFQGKSKVPTYYWLLNKF